MQWLDFEISDKSLVVSSQNVCFDVCGQYQKPDKLLQFERALRTELGKCKSSSGSDGDIQMCNPSWRDLLLYGISVIVYIELLQTLLLFQLLMDHQSDLCRFFMASVFLYYLDVLFQIQGLCSQHTSWRYVALCMKTFVFLFGRQRHKHDRRFVEPRTHHPLFLFLSSHSSSLILWWSLTLNRSR